MENEAKRHGDENKQEGGHTNKTAPIAAIFADCLRGFELLSSMFKTNNEPESAQYPMVEDGFSKFRQWGSDTGAPKRLLDHALRRSPQLKQATEELLKDLLSTLYLTLERTKSIDATQISSSTDYSTSHARSDSPGQSPPSRASSESDSSLQQLSDDIEECVACLIKLAPTLKDPAPQDIHLNKSGHEVDEDVKLAKEMFPNASPSLANRLGFANWRRRQILWNLKTGDNSDSLLDPVFDNDLHQNLKSLQFRDTKITNALDSTALYAHDPSLPSSASYTSAASDDDSVFSKSDYFSSRAATSVAGSDQMTRTKRLIIPKPPVALESGITFDCAYCGQEIVFGDQISSNDDWNRHVFLDLEPYMCTFDDCLRAERTFGFREDWLQHELQSHRLKKFWSCQSCNQEFDEAEDIELHISERHKLSDEPVHLGSVAAICERYSDVSKYSQSCPLCGSFSPTSQILEDHVADHMEQLALFSIQRVYGLGTNQGVDLVEEQLSVKEAKLARLEEFLSKLPGHSWERRQEPLENDSTIPDIVFAKKSESVVAAQSVSPLTVKPAATGSSKRPPMGRRLDSWRNKVSPFRDDQSASHSFEEPLQSTVETPPHTISKLPEDQQPPNEMTHCLRTRLPLKNSRFIGRNIELSRLHKSLSQPGACLIMSGAGGIGKTATAIEYTYRYESSYSYIFWISAESSVSCSDAYSRIATEFVVSENADSYGQDRLISLALEFLEQCQMKWLLVFDNVNSWSDINRYVPIRSQNTLGSILITARASESIDPTAMRGCHFLELEALTLEESRLFLLRSMQPDLESNQVELHSEYSFAGMIAKESEGFPLALSHIAGYVQVSQCTLAEFIQLWNERRRHKTVPTSAANSLIVPTHKALETVWNIGLREVPSDARELLNILAFLDGDRIQRELLVDEHEEPSLDFLHSDQSIRYKRMTWELSRRNLVSLSTENGSETLHIHRSFQQKLLEDLDKDPHKRVKVFSQAFCLVRKKFPLPSPIQVPEPEKWPACKEYLPHVLRFVNVTTKILPSIAPSVRVARLFSDSGINLWERGMTNEGLRLLKSAEAILDRLESDESHLRANIHVIISLLIQDFGLSHIAESKARIRKALKIRLNYRIQTESNLYTRNDGILLHNAWSDYGCVLLQYNEYQRAEPMFQRCLTKYLDWGSEFEIPYEYYKYNHHVAFCRLYQQDFVGAIELAESSLRLIVLATGQSSAASKTRFDLACIVLQSGDTQRALALHRTVLESNLRQHGKFNFLTLQSYYSVGVVSAYCGNIIDAERCMKKALALEQSRKGTWSEVANARTEFFLSQILKEQGKELNTAGQLESQARAVLARLLPLNPLAGVEAGDDIALFDHLQPVFDGRFAGRTLLKYLSRKA